MHALLLFLGFRVSEQRKVEQVRFGALGERPRLVREWFARRLLALALVGTPRFADSPRLLLAARAHVQRVANSLSGHESAAVASSRGFGGLRAREAGFRGGSGGYAQGGSQANFFSEGSNFSSCDDVFLLAPSILLAICSRAPGRVHLLGSARLHVPRLDPCTRVSTDTSVELHEIMLGLKV